MAERVLWRGSNVDDALDALLELIRYVEFLDDVCPRWEDDGGSWFESREQDG